MKKMTSVAALAFAVAALVAPVSRAVTLGSDTAPIEVSLAPGGAKILDFWGPLGEESFALNGSFMAPITPWLSAGLDVGDAFHHEGRYGLKSISALNVTPQFELGAWHPLGRLALKPYVTFGGGYYRLTTDIDNSYFGVSESGSFGGFNYGGGLLVRLSDQLAVGPEIKHHTAFMNDAPDYQYVTGALRLALLF